MTEELESGYDVVVVGGGAAGLNGGLMLARSRRSVAVIDAGAPRNAPAHQVHGLFARDGVPPGELLAQGRAEVRRYGGQVVAGAVTAVTHDDGGFTVCLADGRVTRARRLLVTSGLVDELPEVPGLAERWGREVVHCPYCHGWEVRDQDIAVLGSSPMSVHQALLFRQLSEQVVLVTHTVPAPVGEDAARLAARGIEVVTGPVTALEVVDDRVAGLRLAGGGLVPCQAVAVAARMAVRAGFLAGLGLKPVEHPSGMGDHIPADPAGLTEVAGVYVAGNVTDPSAQVGSAASAGAFAAARINADLVMEEASLPA